MGDRKDKGWEYLHSDNLDDDFLNNEDGSWGYQNEDGSGSYTGADGSWGYKNSDGSASYTGADGSWGYRNSDGSSSYTGADGSWGYKNADGSGVYYDSDNNCTYFNADEQDYDETSDSETSSSGNFIASLIGVGLAGIFATSEIKKTERARQEAEARVRLEAEAKEREEKEKIKKEKRKAFLKKHWKGILVLIAALLIAGLVTFLFIQYKKLTPIGVSSEEAIGRNYEDVLEELYDAGFTNVVTEALENLGIEDLEKENQVSKIIVSGDDEFKATKKVPYDTEIRVEYHTAQIVSVPISAKDAKGQNYEDMLAIFENAGFGNIKVVAEYDLVFGWLSEENEIESIAINDDKKFKSNTTYRVDAEVVITYHAYRKDKKD